MYVQMSQKSWKFPQHLQHTCTRLDPCGPSGWAGNWGSNRGTWTYLYFQALAFYDVYLDITLYKVIQFFINENIKLMKKGRIHVIYSILISKYHRNLLRRRVQSGNPLLEHVEQVPNCLDHHQCLQ